MTGALLAVSVALLGAVDGGQLDAGAGGDARTERLEALLGGTLAVDVAAESLFDVAPLDEPAVELERRRLRLLLNPDAGRRARPLLSLVDIEPAVSAAREALDRARLDFYELPLERRRELLERHRARQVEAAARESDAEQRARQEAERARDAAAAQERIRAARTEAERLVGEELARLVALDAATAEAERTFAATRQRVVERRDAVLGWSRRAREGRASPVEADLTYDALRAALRVTRDDFARALDVLERRPTVLPAVGLEPLPELPAEVSTGEVRRRRAEAGQAVEAARRRELQLQDEDAESLLAAMNALNRERLGLLPALSYERRDDITGFSLAALDQARAEARHLALVLRYHWLVSTGWGRAVRARGLSGDDVWRLVSVLTPWATLTALFLWWRRRSPGVLALAEMRQARADRLARRATPGRARQALTLLRSVHRALEWLAFVWLLYRFLPVEARGLLEVELVSLVLAWWLGGALVVHLVDGLVSMSETSVRDAAAAQLRLRSLRLVGRVVISFALATVLSARLVGEGTIFGWVLTGWWLAVAPVFALLVRWWREVVFARLERGRRKSRLDAWLLENRRGWKSFLAAPVAAVLLFSRGVYKTVRGWVSGFEFARRAHAWIFRRELDRLAEEQEALASPPLDATVSEALRAERLSDTWVVCPADEVVERLLARGPGVVALRAPRGHGKTSVLQRLASRRPGAALVTGALPDELAAQAPGLVLLDDAQRLIKPLQGGLAAFDRALALARRAPQTLWVFALDDLLWPFLLRAREGVPLFDEVVELEPWSDEQLGELLLSRTKAAGCEVVFDDLLERLPPSADEVDRQDALAARRAGYFRMMWDFARGNPAMALEAWRASLVSAAPGQVRVRPVGARDTSALERLPDPGLFVLRAVLQLEPALPEELEAATRLPPAAISSTLRFALDRGVLADDGGRLRVAPAWLRAVMVLLERRHLVVTP